MAVVVISTIVIVLDLVSKYIIESQTALQNVEIIPGFFSLTFAKNTAMAWSLLSGKQALFLRLRLVS